MTSIRVFSAVYMNRSLDGDALAAMNGPTIHISKLEALQSVAKSLSYDIDRCLKADFLEECPHTNVLAESGIILQDLSSQVIKDHMLSLPEDALKEVIEWTIDSLFVDGENEVFYKVTDHSTNTEYSYVQS